MLHVHALRRRYRRRWRCRGWRRRAAGRHKCGQRTNAQYSSQRRGSQKTARAGTCPDIRQRRFLCNEPDPRANERQRRRTIGRIRVSPCRRRCRSRGNRRAGRRYQHNGRMRRRRLPVGRRKSSAVRRRQTHIHYRHRRPPHATAKEHRGVLTRCRRQHIVAILAENGDDTLTLRLICNQEEDTRARVHRVLWLMCRRHGTARLTQVSCRERLGRGMGAAADWPERSSTISTAPRSLFRGLHGLPQYSTGIPHYFSRYSRYPPGGGFPIGACACTPGHALAASLGRPQHHLPPVPGWTPCLAK